MTGERQGGRHQNGEAEDEECGKEAMGITVKGASDPLKPGAQVGLETQQKKRERKPRLCILQTFSEAVVNEATSLRRNTGK